MLSKYLESAVKRSFKHIIILKYYQMLTVYWFESHPSLCFCNGWMQHWFDGLHKCGCIVNVLTRSECSDILVQSWGSRGFRDYYKKQKGYF